MTDDEIKAQQRFLEVHRTNARVFYDQKLQTQPVTPPYIIAGLEQAQKEIYQIKLAFRDANVPFENLSFDGEPVEQNIIPRIGAVQIDSSEPAASHATLVAVVRRVFRRL